MFFIQVSLVGTLTGTACDGGSNGYGAGGVHVAVLHQERLWERRGEGKSGVVHICPGRDWDMERGVGGNHVQQDGL